MCTAGENCETLMAPCSSKPCKYGGVCQESEDYQSFSCVCPEGWQGKHEHLITWSSQQEPPSIQSNCIDHDDLIILHICHHQKSRNLDYLPFPYQPLRPNMRGGHQRMREEPLSQRCNLPEHFGKLPLQLQTGIRRTQL